MSKFFLLQIILNLRIHYVAGIMEQLQLLAISVDFEELVASGTSETLKFLTDFNQVLRDFEHDSESLDQILSTFYKSSEALEASNQALKALHDLDQSSEALEALDQALEALTDFNQASDDLWALQHALKTFKPLCQSSEASEALDQAVKALDQVLSVIKTSEHALKLELVLDQALKASDQDIEALWDLESLKEDFNPVPTALKCVSDQISTAIEKSLADLGTAGKLVQFSKHSIPQVPEAPELSAVLTVLKPALRISKPTSN